MQEITSGRAKRIRWLYLPENVNSLENSVLHPESLEFPPFPSTVDNSSLKPCLAAEPTSSKSTECDSSASNLEVPDSNQVSKSSGKKVLLLVIGILCLTPLPTFSCQLSSLPYSWGIVIRVGPSDIFHVQTIK